jgi:hypothetical protein
VAVNFKATGPRLVYGPFQALTRDPNMVIPVEHPPSHIIHGDGDIYQRNTRLQKHDAKVV